MNLYVVAMLTETNIQLYKNKRPNNIHFIHHDMLYYNIVTIADYLGKNSLAQLVADEALMFYQSLNTNAALSFIAQNLKRSLGQNRVSTCLQLVEKFQKVIEHAKNFSAGEERQKIMINTLFVSTLLKLNIV